MTPKIPFQEGATIPLTTLAWFTVEVSILKAPLNLLVTNTQEDQAYLVVRSLRGEASKIVIGLHGNTVLQRWSGLAPYSRYVNKRYRLPDPGHDWWAGRIQPDNTEVEEYYIRRVEEICAREDINAIFASFDPDIYVFSKNTVRLAEQGVVVVGPDYQTLMTPLSKELTLRAAERAGFPCPKTWTPTSIEELDEIIACVHPPWVIKPRFTAHGRDTRVVHEPSELRRLFAEISSRQKRPLVQEFIAGNRKRNFYVTVDRDFRILSLLTPEVIRTRKRGVDLVSAAVVSSSTGPYIDQLHTLVRNLEYWGCLTIQTKVDSTDGKPKFLEINPRVGDHLWFRTELGVNEPLIFLRLAQEQALPEIQAYPEGVFLLDPMDDFRNLAECSMAAGARALRSTFSASRQNGLESERSKPGAMLRDIKANYSGKNKKVLSPYVRYMFEDPLPCNLRNLKILSGILRVFLLLFKELFSIRRKSRIGAT